MDIAASRIGISVMADRYGVSLRTLRFYEERGLLQPLRQGTERLYAPADEVRLQLVLKGKKLGFTLYEIYRLVKEAGKTAANDDGFDIYATLDQDKIREQMTALEEQRVQIDEAIAELRSVAARMRGEGRVDAMPHDAMPHEAMPLAASA